MVAHNRPNSISRESDPLPTFISHQACTWYVGVCVRACVCVYIFICTFIHTYIYKCVCVCVYAMQVKHSYIVLKCFLILKFRNLVIWKAN